MKKDDLLEHYITLQCILVTRATFSNYDQTLTQEDWVGTVLEN